KGKTIVLTTHYMEEAQTLCDRIAVMDGGKIIALDTPEQLINQNFETAAIEFDDRNGATIEMLSALPGVKEAKRDGGLVTLYSYSTPQTIEAMITAAREGRIAFDDLRVLKATLEDVFLKLTGRRIRDSGARRMKAFIPLYMANVREFVRDRSALFWTAAFPVMFILIFGVIFTGGDDISFSIGVVNEDGAASERLVENFQEIDAFNVTVAEREQELSALEDGDRSAVIVIPQGTGAAIGSAITPASDRQSKGAALEVYYDPADQNTSQIVLN